MKLITPDVMQLKMLVSIKNQTWMMRPDRVAEFALSGLEASQPKEESEENDCYDMRTPAHIDGAGIGHVEIKGALLQKCPKRYERRGIATTYKTITEETQFLIEAGAKGILFHVNSPGGTVAGNKECAKFIQNLSIPTAAHCDGLACSAGYKLACSAGNVWATESSEVGNIGTILSWADCTEFWRESGIEFKALVNDGADLKSTFHLEPDETQIQFLQESIDEAGEEFRTHVEENRPGIDPEVFRAGWYHGEKAGRLGLIDAILTEHEAAEHFAHHLTPQPQS